MAVVHAAHVAFVVIGFALIIAGLVMGLEWSRAFWFRGAHLIAIVFVCMEAVMGVVCPLTTLESRLRGFGGETGYSRDFVGYWVDRLIFYDLPMWVFMFAYVALGVAVVNHHTRKSTNTARSAQRAKRKLGLSRSISQ